MMQRIFRWFSLGIMVWAFAAVSVFGSPAQEQDTKQRRLTVHLQGVFDAKVSLIPFKGLNAVYSKPVGEVLDVKNGETATIEVPAQYLPGEFLLKIDYRTKEIDHPYPAERSIFINKQNIELTINPPYINNNDKTKFSADEKENTVYIAFMEENNKKRMPIVLLRQFLLSYDRPKSKLYKQAVKESKQRRGKYNLWLGNQARVHSKLYVSNIFQFQHIPEMTWKGSESEHISQMAKNYFEGIDFSNPIIIRLRELAFLMDGYMKLYGMQSITEELRDSLFAEAGRIACEKASHGNPKVYGWMVDYFYKGYETYGIKGGMAILKKHIDNPNCLTSKKQQIVKRLEGMERLAPGALSPDFISSDREGNNFEFHKWRGRTRYKLLLFWSTTCESCRQLIDGLKQWYNQPANKEKIDIIAVSLDDRKAEVERWEALITGLSGWEHLRAKGGVNSLVANDYAILSTPAMFLIGSENNIIVSSPDNLEQLIDDLEEGIAQKAAF